jgi:light-regulated signal transduction histidine kinase (bacteriophytochrome)
MAVQILPEHGCYALWFRPEVISTVTWAGNHYLSKPLRQADLLAALERWQIAMQGKALTT